MSIALLKEIEDNKQILSDLNKQYSKQLDDKIKSKVKIAYNEFKRFFIKQDFKIEEKPADLSNTVVAKYGSMKITLTYNLNTEFMGALTVLYLIVEIKDYKKFRILLNRKNNSNHTSFRILTSTKDPNKQKQEQELTNILKQIKESQKKLENFEQETLAYLLYDESDCNCGSFDSLVDILNFVIE